MQKIFISYRRQDSAVFTGRLYDRLIDYYGVGVVFLDIDSIPVAASFPVELQKSIRDCKVVLAIIGKHWTGQDGREPMTRRIDDPDDFVRLELEQALIQNKKMIPVYFDQCKPLTAPELPQSLVAISTAQAIEVDIGKDFDHHVSRLRKEVNRYIFPSTIEFLRHATTRTMQRNRSGLMFFVACCFLVFLFRDPIGRMLMPHSGVHAVVERADSNVFSGGAHGKYQLARGLANRDMLVTETDLVSSIRESKHTLDMFALTGTAMVSNYEAINYAMDRGVHFRVVIFDHSDQNKTYLDDYFRIHSTTITSVEWSKTNAKQVVEFIQRQHTHPKGKIEIRVWRGPFLNSMWIRDSEFPESALGHIEVTYYGELVKNPSLRFGKLSPAMVASLQEQFEYIWSNSQEPLGAIVPDEKGVATVSSKSN